MTDQQALTATNLRLEDLPAWMRPRRRQVDWGLLTVLAFSLLVALPLITRPDLPRDTDAELYEYRSWQVAQLVRAGVLFSRWAPNLNYEYGSPLFNYLAPLPHYLPGFHQALTETGPVESVKLFLVLAIFAAGGGMYLFARQRWGIPAGVVAALAYLHSGPIMLSLPYLFGDLAPLMGLGLLPWAAWGFDSLWLRPGKPAFWLALAALVGFLLCDARIAGLGGAVLFMVVASGRWLPGAAGRGHPARYVLGVILAAIGLTAFFWLPALVETDQVRYTAVTTAPYAGSIALEESLGSLPRFAPQMLNMPVYRGIGIGPALLALAGMLALVARRNTLRAADTWLFLVLGLMLLALSTPALYDLWPPPAVFQTLMPYHAVLVATFCLAAVSGRAALWLEMPGRWRSTVVFLALCLAAPLAAIPALHPPAWGARLDSADTLWSLQQELQGSHAATLRHGVLLPASTPRLPLPLPNLVENIRSETFDRVNRQRFSADSRIDELHLGPLSYRWILNTQDTVNAELYVLNYPGWQARIGDQSIPVNTSAQGFIEVRLPAINGELAVWLGGTPARDLAWLITVVSSLLLFAASRRRWPEHSADDSPAPALPRRYVGALLAALLLHGGLSLWLRQNPDLLLPQMPRGVVYGPYTPLPRFLQGGVDLLGYRLSTASPRPGDTLEITIFWQAARPLLENNESEVWLINPHDRQRLLRIAHRHPGGIPTLRWALDAYVRDDFALPLPPDLPVGDYILQVAIGPCASRSVLPCDSIQGMDAYNALGQAERGAVTVPEVIRVR